MRHFANIARKMVGMIGAHNYSVVLKCSRKHSCAKLIASYFIPRIGQSAAIADLVKCSARRASQSTSLM